MVVLRRSFSSSLRPLRNFITFLFGCLLAITASQMAFAKASFAVRPPQSWIRTIDFKVDPGTEEALPSNGSSFLLDDHQTRVGEKTVDRYYHHVQKIDTAAGLSDLSQLRFYFEPSFQQLAVHFIRIHRGDALIDGLRPSEIRVIQQEEELNQQLYNGTLAAIVFLNDLRVGDIVDYAYTVSGENPVLGNRFTDTFYLAERQPIQLMTHRLVWPSNRFLSVKNDNTEIAPKVRESESGSEYIWEQRNTKAVLVEDDTPGWFNPYPRVSLSEFRNWNDVVQWAMPLYASANLKSPNLISKVKKWQDDLDSPEKRMVAALRFVQDEIRYLGIELGRYSHQPTLPEKVFARRFGDCKDKSLLLSTILQAMDIDAVPALVHSTAGRSLDNRQPSPFAFDHVIVQVKLNGKTYWLDPTISYQRGGLDKYYDPSYERALALREAASELERIPFPAQDSGSIIVREQYDGQNAPGPISLLVWTKYLGAEADNMRYYLASQTVAELSKSYLNYYADENPVIRADGLPQVEDDQNSNTIVVKEKYLIGQFWKDTKHRFVAEKIYAETKKPGVSQRSMPLGLRYPVSINQTIEINLSEPYTVTPERGTFSDEAIRFEYAYSTAEDGLKLEYSLSTFADSVPVEKVQRHLVVLDRIRDFVGFELSSGSGPIVRNAGGGPTLGPGVVVFFVVVPLLVVTVLIVRRRRTESRRTQFAGELKAKVGFAPETAIRVPSENEIDGVLRNFKCGCGQHPYRPESPPQRERFSYDGKRLVGLRLHCPDCGRNSDLYLNPRMDLGSESA